MEKKQFPVIDMKATGENIKALMNSAEITVSDVQKYFGFANPQAVYHWINGERIPQIDNLLALSKLLNVPLENLLIYNYRDR